MRIINYTTKTTNATTEYRNISSGDREWLFEQLDEISRISTTKTDPRLILGHKSLIRKGDGTTNSIKSAAEGILDNFRNGTQYDFSERTCTLIEQITSILNGMFSDWDIVKFVEVDSLETIKVEISKAVTAKPLDLPTQVAHNIDMSQYVIDTMTITYRRKIE